MPESFHFLRPDWLWALLPAALLVVLAWRARPSSGAWARICDAHLLRHLAVDGDGAGRRWPLALLGLGWAAAVIALAGPAWEKLPQPSYKQKTPTIIALDMSRSMGIGDVSPSRMERARFKVIDALRRLDGGQVGLVVFAEEPFVAAPLTDDPKVIRDMVPTLETRIMPGSGSRTDRAIAMAHDLLDQADAGKGRVLLIADGVGTHVEEAEAAAAALAKAGHQLAVLGVGTETGGPVPGLTRQDGSPVVVGLETDRLRKVADAAGGTFTTLTPDDSDLARLLDRPVAADPLDQAFEKTDSKADVWRDMGVWLVLLPLALAPFAFRRGWLAAALIGAALAQGLPAPARAGWFDDLWARRDQQGAAALDGGDPAAAARLFEDPSWRAAAQYRAEDYGQAAESLSHRTGAEDRYNLGNALAKAGKIEEAIAAYDLALDADPKHADAAYNRDLLKRLLEEEKKREEQKKQQEQKQQGQDRQQNQGQQGQDQKQAQGQQGQDRKQAQGQQGQDRKHAQGQQGQDQKQDQGQQGQDRKQDQGQQGQDQKQAQGQQGQDQKQAQGQQGQDRKQAQGQQGQDRKHAQGQQGQDQKQDQAQQGQDRKQDQGQQGQDQKQAQAQQGQDRKQAQAQQGQDQKQPQAQQGQDQKQAQAQQGQDQTQAQAQQGQDQKQAQGQQGQDQKQAQAQQGQDQKQPQAQQGQDQTQARAAPSADDAEKAGERDQSRDDREAKDEAARESADDSWAMGRPSEAAPDTAPRARGSSDGTRRLQYSEHDQALEQMLRRVPDDPGGLLRAKLYRRYAERRYEREEVTQPW